MEKHDRTQRLVRLVTPVVEKLIPPAQRAEALAALEERRQSARRFLQEAAYLVVDSYVIQSEGFNKALFAAELVGLIYCFSCILLPLPLFFLTVAVLGALTCFDFYTSTTIGARPAPPVATTDSDSQRERQSALTLHYADELIAAITVLLTLLAVGFFSQHGAPSMAGSSLQFFHGTLVFIPLVAVVRMMLRPRPSGNSPLRRSKTSIDQLYKRTRVMNDLFMVLCFYVIAKNTDLGFASLPGYRVLLYVVSVLTFVLWVRLTQNALARDSKFRTAFKWEQQETAQRIANLHTELQKNDPLYKPWAVLNVLLPLLLAAPLAADLLPWIAGRGLAVSPFQFGANLSLFVAVTVSWNAVKRINQEMAKLLQPPSEAPAASPAAANAST